MADRARSSRPPPKPSRQLARLPFFYGWVVVAVAFVTMGIGVNARTAFSLLFPPILDEFGWDRATIAGAFSIGFFASAFYTPFIGMAMDRFGPRLVIPFGVLLVAAGLVLATGATRPWQFDLSLGVLVVGGSVFVSYIGHSLFLPHWFVRRRGLATGIAFSGVGVGSILLFPWLQSLIGTAGWRSACFALAGLLLAVLLAAQPPAPAPAAGRSGPDARWRSGSPDVIRDHAGRRQRRRSGLGRDRVDARTGDPDAPFLVAVPGVLQRPVRLVRGPGPSDPLSDRGWLPAGARRLRARPGRARRRRRSDRDRPSLGPGRARMGLDRGGARLRPLLSLPARLARAAEPAPALRHGRRPGPARLRPRHGLRRDSGRAVPGPALRHHLRHAQQRLDPRRRERPLGRRPGLRPGPQLCPGLLARDRALAALDRLHLARRPAQGPGGRRPDRPPRGAPRRRAGSET